MGLTPADTTRLVTKKRTAYFVSLDAEMRCQKKISSTGGLRVRRTDQHYSIKYIRVLACGQLVNQSTH